jgi:MoaA/NifB/PqqE/SkfB family radical SAM enzyme
LAELAEELKIHGLGFGRLVPVGRGAKMRDEMLSVEETRRVMMEIHRIGEELRVKYSRDRKGPLLFERHPLSHLVAPREAIRHYLGHDRKMGATCAVGISTLAILTDGTVLGCRRLPIPIGNVRETSLLEIWYGSRLLEEFRERNKHLKGTAMKNTRFFAQDHRDITPLVRVNDHQIAR